jgi:two-component system response regulator GlrR
MTDKEFIMEDLILQSKGVVSQEPVKPISIAKNAFEKSYLIYLLEICKGNVTEAAKSAGKYRGDFYTLLKKHHIHPADFKEAR